MSVLIINRRTDLDYKQWFQDVSPIVLISQVELEDVSYCSHYEVIPNFDMNCSVELKVIELHAKYKFQAIVAISEMDIVRVAELRELLNIPGQSRESAIAFRNKVVMKDEAQRAGVKTAAYQEIQSIMDVYQFIHKHGYPVIIKPIDLGGSMGVAKIEDEQQLTQYLKHQTLKNLMIEQFVNGEMYHIDGLMVEREIKFLSMGKYLSPCMSFQAGKSLGSVLIGEQTTAFHQLKDALDLILASFPGSPVLPFHAEFFITESNEVYLCEIASRIGGPGINDTNRLIYGMDLMESWSRLQCGIDVDFGVNKEGKHGGWLLIPPADGEIIDIPEQIPFDWVVEYITPYKRGTKIAKAQHSADSIAALFMTAESAEQCVARIMEIDHWFRRALMVSS